MDMKITDLRDHFSHTFSRSNAARIACLLEQYDHPKIQNSYLASPKRSSSKIYYIIWRKGGGFFSILSSVLCHLQIAESRVLSQWLISRTLHLHILRINKSTAATTCGNIILSQFTMLHWMRYINQEISS